MDFARTNARLAVRSQISARLVVGRSGPPLCRISRRAFGAQTSLRASAVATKSRVAASPRNAWKNAKGPDGPDLNLEYVKAGSPPGSYHPVFLRDACRCSQCVDPSTTQKNFSTTDIPADIQAESVRTTKDGQVEVKWTKDVPGFGSDHISTFSQEFFNNLVSLGAKKNSRAENFGTLLWDKQTITAELKAYTYDEFMTEDEPLFRAFLTLQSHGLLLVRGIPDSEKAVEDIANRIGGIRETFYGRTWDVKTVAGAENVAYTDKPLGLHQDLLYLKDPPAFQVLHCLKNTVEGGVSRFADGFSVASKFAGPLVESLGSQKLAFQYKNAGKNYYQERTLIEFHPTEKLTVKNESRRAVTAINWSPPFQAELPFTVQRQGHPLPKFLNFLRKFAGLAEYEHTAFSYKLKEGEAFIFNNRRILHGRTAFESKTGERFLKGAYVDGDAYMSKLRNLYEKFKSTNIRAKDEDGRHINPEEHAAYRAKRAATLAAKGLGNHAA